jgi:hypothetical protein
VANRVFDDDLIGLGNTKQEMNRSWQEVADCLNDRYDLCNTKDFYRKRYSKLISREEKELYDSNDISDMLLKLKKERVKMSDERIQNNAYIRQLARDETIKEIAFGIAEKIGTEKILSISNREVSGENSAILQLSDWHYGIECNNYWNVYNPEVCKKRIEILSSETIRYCRKNNVKNLYVLNLSDLISGRIHTTIRLQNRYDVLTQIIHVSEILSEMLNVFSEYFNVFYYDCSDNHSRIEPNKSESMDEEQLTRITHWYLKKRFDGDKNVKVCENTYGNDIITLDIDGHSIGAVHGDKDSPSDVVERLSLMTGKSFELILIGHLHHFGADEVDSCVVLQNGSLMGTDYYAVRLRKRAVPSQNIVLINKECVANDIHRVTF